MPSTLQKPQVYASMGYKIKKASKMSNLCNYYKITCTTTDENDSPEQKFFIGYCKCYCTENPFDRYNRVYAYACKNGVVNQLTPSLNALHGSDIADIMIPHKLSKKMKGLIVPHYEKCQRLPRAMKEVRHIWYDGEITILPMYSEMAIIIRSAIMRLQNDEDIFKVNCSTSGEWVFKLIKETPYCYIVTDADNRQ